MKHPGRRDPHSGATFVVVAVALVFLLAMAGLAIDLASLYVARSQAQRAADAAALAGADEFVLSDYTSGLTTAPLAQTLAAQQAADVGNQNLVDGRNPAIAASGIAGSCPPAPGQDGCFNFTNANDPRITVVVQMTKARHDAIPTFFMKIFGINSVNVSASATAEAYTPTGGSGPPVGTSCLKPWIVPNVDPLHTVTATFTSGLDGSTQCPPAAGNAPAMTDANWYYPVGGTCSSGVKTQFYATYINPSSNPQQITNPGGYSSGGVVGEPITLKPDCVSGTTCTPLPATAPSQFYPITIPPGTVPAACPNCTGPGGGSSTTGGNLYAQNIECCNTNTVSCYEGVDLQTQTGNLQGPTEQGVECLIHENAQTETGQDTICGTSVLGAGVPATCGPPFTYYGGLDNPNPNWVSQPGITYTSSIVTSPIFDGSPFSPGQSSGSSTVTIIGFVQFFINSVDGPGQNQGNVHAIVLNPITCGSQSGSGSGGNGSGGSGTISTGANPIPVRLIHN